MDYKNKSVVDDVVAAVQKIGGDFVGVYDAISVQGDSYTHTVPILEKLGGGSLATVLPGPENPPSNVKAGNVFGINDLTHAIWVPNHNSTLSPTFADHFALLSVG